MKKRQKIDATYFENHDFGEELYEAERTGNLIITEPGETAIEAIKRHMEAKKNVPVSMRLPAGIIKEVKGRAATAGIPWTSYIRVVLERSLAEQPAH